ncbi:MAG: UDP-N-acetylmuramoyl-tripeptide--D-alanyl-D-alanine ligase [Bacteroidetes bacterium]|nr:UDP-N-acetylmuramoyl-tripeptide--D-alanyl-D-alanine ligase [Bacteroidota bacterium]
MKDLYSLFLKYPSVSTDSRNIGAGDLFFALKGDNFDGNDYAEKALESGAAYAVIDRPELFETSPFGRAAEEKERLSHAEEGMRLILVSDVLAALQQLARHHRQALKTPVVALTGTNGKTTTKELIAAVLSTKYKVCATEGNLNNHIGVPLTLLRMDKTTQVAVVEMGANHPGEIASIAAIAQPDYGLITNVGKAHLEGFGSLEGVMQTKGALYESAQRLFVNADNPLLCGMANERGGQKEKHWYGLKYQKASIWPVDGLHPFLRLEVWGYPTIETQLIGAYNADNVLAALSVGRCFGVDPLLAAAAIKQYRPSNNRSQWMQTAQNALIVDAYNANPTSMAAALDNFEQLPLQNKAVILGDMLELGADSEQEHITLIRRLVRLHERGIIGQIFLVGPKLGLAAGEHLCCRCFTNAGALNAYLSEHQLTDSVILIKGSRGMRLEQVLEVL